MEILAKPIKGAEVAADKMEVTVFLKHKKYVFDSQKKIVQK